jgi:hypothetical protein
LTKCFLCYILDYYCYNNMFQIDYLHHENNSNLDIHNMYIQ